MKQKQKLNYLKVTVNNQIDRYWVPIHASDKNSAFQVGDKLKVYGFCEHEFYTKSEGKKMILIRFKRNFSRKFTHWIVSEYDFYENITIHPNKSQVEFLKKISVESK